MHAKSNLQGDVIAGSVTVGVVSIIAVLLRIKARRLRSVPLAADDYIMIVAAVLSWGVVVGNVIATHYGLGRHIVTLSSIELITLMKVFLASQIVWAIAVPAVRCSILMQYLRIFGIVTYIRICAWFLIAVSMVWGLVMVLVLLMKCQPFAYNWDKSLDGHCIDETMFYKIGTATNVVEDFLVLVLPMPVIWSLNVRLSKKLQVIAVFAIASMSCAFSTARFVSLFRIKGIDATYELAIPCIWSAIEPCLGIVAASLATMGPLIELLKKKFRNSTPQSSTLVSKSYKRLTVNQMKDARSPSSTENIALEYVVSSMK